jgi:hypothetical protein
MKFPLRAACCRRRVEGGRAPRGASNRPHLCGCGAHPNPDAHAPRRSTAAFFRPGPRFLNRRTCRPMQRAPRRAVLVPPERVPGPPECALARHARRKTALAPSADRPTGRTPLSEQGGRIISLVWMLRISFGGRLQHRSPDEAKRNPWQRGSPVRLLNRSWVSSQNGRGARSLASTRSVPRRRE